MCDARGGGALERGTQGTSRGELQIQGSFRLYLVLEVRWKPKEGMWGGGARFQQRWRLLHCPSPVPLTLPSRGPNLG